MKLKYLFILLAAAAIVGACRNNAQSVAEPAEEEEQTQTDMKEENKNLWTNLGEEPLLKISTTDGDMVVKLYKETPLHRDNFVKLA